MAIYKTTTGNTYEFSFEKQSDGSIRAYIVRQPSYGSRDTDPHKIHRLKDGDRHYVCWDKKLYAMSDARSIAEGWAKHTDRYIRSGVPFDRPGSSPARDDIPSGRFT